MCTLYSRLSSLSNFPDSQRKIQEIFLKMLLFEISTFAGSKKRIFYSMFHEFDTFFVKYLLVKSALLLGIKVISLESAATSQISVQTAWATFFSPFSLWMIIRLTFGMLNSFQPGITLIFLYLTHSTEKWEKSIKSISFFLSFLFPT